MPYRSSSWTALACAAVPLVAHADVMLHFDSARGSCELLDRGGVPTVKCDAAGNPSISLGAKVVREVVGNSVEFRFPDAGEITITPEADGQRIAWKARAVQAGVPGKIAATPAATSVPAAATPAASMPRVAAAAPDSSGAPVDEHGVLSVSGANAGTPGPAATDEASALAGALKALLPEMQKDVQE